MDTKTLEKAQKLLSMIKKYEELIDFSKHSSSKIVLYTGNYYRSLDLPKEIEKKVFDDVVNAWKEEKKILEDEFNNL